MAYDAVVSRFIVSGSSVSCLATLGILLYSLSSRGKHPSLRHALVVNLCLASKLHLTVRNLDLSIFSRGEAQKAASRAFFPHLVDIQFLISDAPTDFLNTLNTTISGFIYVDTHQLHPGYACRANGFFNLITAQAVDFTILTIVFVTLLAVIRLVQLPSLSDWRFKTLICSFIWVVPMVTSLTALAMGALRPVDTNWCDITAVRPDLRYALASGWRLAIMLLAMCFYIFIWCFIHQNYSVFSVTTSAKIPPKHGTHNRLVGPVPVTSVPSRLSASQPAVQSSRPNLRERDTLCSDMSLPLQGRDSLGVESQERETAIHNRTERISRWIRVRHPGMINSISSFKFQSQAKLLSPQATPNRPFIQAATVAAKPNSQDLLRPTLLRPSPPPSTRPNYHNECPKVKKSFEISIEDGSGIARSAFVTRQKQNHEPQHHDPARSVKSVGGRTQSSLETVPWRIRSAGQLRAHEVKWPFFDLSRSPAQSSDEASTTNSSEEHLNSNPHCHSLSPATGALDTCNSQSDHFKSCQTTIHPIGDQDLDRRYSTRVPPQARLPRYRYEQIQERSESIHHNKVIAKYPFERPVNCVRNDAASMPTYHSHCPTVQHTLEVSTDTPQETRPGPNYHNQCPKVTKTVSVSPSGPNYHNQCPKVTKTVNVSPSRPSLPKSPPLILRPDICSTKTTIITAPREPPPSPTPGLPPPPWSPEIKLQRRKTFLLSRSTWSDSTKSQHFPSTSEVAKNDRETRLMLGLNAYPLAYFILLLPWMVDCFIEAQGYESNHPRAMHVLLGLPQYLGLVNAIIFCVNEWLKTMRRKAGSAEFRRVADEKGSFNSNRGRCGRHTWDEE